MQQSYSNLATLESFSATRHRFSISKVEIRKETLHWKGFEGGSAFLDLEDLEEMMGDVRSAWSFSSKEVPPERCIKIQCVYLYLSIYLSYIYVYIYVHNIDSNKKHMHIHILVHTPPNLTPHPIFGFHINFGVFISFVVLHPNLWRCSELTSAFWSPTNLGSFEQNWKRIDGWTRS